MMQVKLGIHAYAWQEQWRRDPLDVFERVRDAGLDFIEMPLMELDRLDARAVREHLRRTGLEACTSTVLSESTDITSDAPEIRRNGMQYLKACVEFARQIGAPFVSGVIYARHAKPVTGPPSEAEWQHSAAALREVARFASDRGISIGLEPINRYESHLINTCEQALRLREMIGEPNVKIHLDTYHMNIEEKDIYRAVKLAGEHLLHLHVAENDRGIPGSGSMRWTDLFKALAEIRYDGFVATESFVEPSRSTWTWRALVPDADTLVREGVQFLRAMMMKCGLDRGSSGAP